MKVIAFFNLNSGVDPTTFLDWANGTQAGAFHKHLPQMRNFEVYQRIDADNCSEHFDMVQTFDWIGSAQEWREALRDLQASHDPELEGLVNTWRSFCDEASTQILYAAVP